MAREYQIGIGRLQGKIMRAVPGVSLYLTALDELIFKAALVERLEALVEQLDLIRRILDSRMGPGGREG